MVFLEDGQCIIQQHHDLNKLEVVLMQNKPVVEIFTPEGVCGCVFSHWIDKVWNILMNYREYVKIETSTSGSERAKEVGIGAMAILVNGRQIRVEDLVETLDRLLA